MISCSKVQRPLAKRLHDKLEKHDCSPRLDDLDIGEGDRWRHTVAWWLSACQVAVVLLSEEALASAWVNFELSVLAHREQMGNLRLVIVYVGVTRDQVAHSAKLDHLQLGNIQARHELPDAEPDEAKLDALTEVVVGALDLNLAPPFEPLVVRVADAVREVADHQVATARADLDGPELDPWLLARPEHGPELRRDLGEAYCATPLERAYPALQTLAQDDHLTREKLHELVDLNVITAFDPKTIDQLQLAGLGRAPADEPRSLVVSITRADLARVATDSVRFEPGVLYPFCFVVQGPVSGRSQAEVVDGLARELLDTVGERADEGETPEEFLAAVTRRRHPVFVLLAVGAGLTAAVVAGLEARFQGVVFVVLSSADQRMIDLADALGLPGVGAALDDPTAWAAHVDQELALAAERTSVRNDLNRVKRDPRP
jgi:hypothetical protein